MFNLLNRVFQKSEMNFESLFDMISSEMSQFAINNRSSNVSAQLLIVHVNLSKIIVILFEILQVTIKVVFIFFDRADIKFIVNVLNEIFCANMSTSSS